jgi:hypothetical protein
MIYALVKNGVIENTIVADESFVSLIQPDWDFVLRIDQMENQPAIGWGYADGVFSEPVVENEGE